MPSRKQLPQPDHSRDFETEVDLPEDPTLSGGLPPESCEAHERQSVRTDSGCEEPDREEEEQEGVEGEEEDNEEDSSASDSSDDDDFRKPRKTWKLCQEIHKANRPWDSIHREICAFLENDLRMAEYRIFRDESCTKQYWGGWYFKDVSCFSI